MASNRYKIMPLSVLAALFSSLAVWAPAEADIVDPALTVVDSWDVTGPGTFPDGANRAARVPALLEAPNGDLLTFFSTTGDAHPGGELRLIRSSDEGRTWGASEVVAHSELYGEAGSIASARGEATLDDGTLLVAYSDGMNHVEFNNRESRVFVARSTDDGYTWSGTESPIDTPMPMREAWVAGQILELSDGTLLLPVWGTLELTADWEADPMRWRSGVLRSFDGGQTWSDYQTLAYDPNNPPQYPPFHGAKYTSGANEAELHELPGGRIVAVIRYATGVGANKGQVYLSYSDDAGANWSAPVATGQQAEALSLTYAPCTDRLDDGEAKLVMGHRELSASGERIGQTALHVSFDGGVTWGGKVRLEDPGGATHLGSGTGEPAFHRLSANRLLVLFQVLLPGQPAKIVANVVQDASDDVTCQAQAAAAADAAAATPTFFLERADRGGWAWPFASRKVSFGATTTVGEVIESAGGAVSCVGPGLRLTKHGSPLNPAATLGEAGVDNGSVLYLSGPPRTQPWRVGFAELDIAPESRHVYGWDRACASGSWAFDYRSRSLGLDIRRPGGKMISAVELRDRDAATRLTGDSYRLLSSADNETYTEVTGWSFSSRVIDGRVVHRFDGLSLTDRYLKIHQPHTDASYSFVLANTREDISVEFDRWRPKRPA